LDPLGISGRTGPTAADIPWIPVRSARRSQSLGDHPPTDSPMRRARLAVTPLEGRSGQRQPRPRRDGERQTGGDPMNRSRPA